MQENSKNQKEKQPILAGTPFGDALRKILSTPPMPNIKQKVKQAKKTGK